MSYDNIPHELRAFNQWINWRYEKVTETDSDGKTVIKWKKLPIRTRDGYQASVTDPRDWTDFETAKRVAVAAGYGMGFVFTKSDPFTGFDFDDAQGNPGVIETQQGMHSYLNSYSEYSPSGNGIHVIVNASLPGTGRRRGKIECYDNFRFFTFTGNVYNNAPIADRQLEAVALYNTLGADISVVAHDGMQSETMSDADVIAHAAAAANGDKFRRLWSGDWQTDYGTKSQSEADFALVNIVAFYSRNASQTMRIFRSSQLGARAKAQRGDYLSRMVRRSFDRMLPTVTINPTPSADGVWFDASVIDPWIAKLTNKSLGTFYGSEWHPDVAPVTTYAEPQQFAPQVHVEWSDEGAPVDLPPPIPPIAIPGLCGQLVQHTWQAAGHQIAEVAVVSALSTMSLLCSRSYRHGTLGLNLYLLLLAQTSTGKSFGYTANDTRFNAMIQRYRNMPPPKHLAAKARADLLSKMVISEFGSAQGLAQHMPDAPSTLAQLDEYVDNIRMMAQPHPPPVLAQIRAELLKLMEMSGPGRIYRARKYSKRANNAEETVDVISASLSIFATGTPNQFYDEISSTLLTTGFLPRFTIMEYTGNLVTPNDNVQLEPSAELINNMSFLYDKAVNMSSTLIGSPNEFVDVQFANKNANEAMRWFENVCIRNAVEANNGNTNMAGMWSRAKEHVRQIASLIAIGCNPNVPLIEAEHVDIAVKLVRPTIDKINRMVTGGEIGIGDDRLEAEIKKIVYQMVTDGWYRFRNYPGIRRELFDNGFFQMSVIRNICLKTAAFKLQRNGASSAFERAINDMVKYGVLKRSDANGFACVTPLEALN